MNKLAKGLIAASSALALGVGSAAISAAPAFAYDDSVVTQTMDWQAFNSGSANISDAYYFDNTFGIEGWTGDIFDTYFDTYAWYEGGGETALTNWVEDSSGLDNGGVSTWSGHQTVTIDTIDITVNLTVTFDGNYVKYSYAVATTGNIALVQINVEGASGANDSVCYDFTIDDTFITTDLYDGSDSDCDVTADYPSAGYVGDSVGVYQLMVPMGGAIQQGWEVANGNENILAYVQGGATFDIIVGAFDYNPLGGFQLAYSHAEDVTGGPLSDAFGEQTKTFGNDFSIADASYGGAEKSLPVVTGDAVATVGYLNDGSVVWTDGKVSGLPAGVTGTFVQDETTGDLSLTLSGTPTETGSFTPEVVLYHPALLLALTDTIGDHPVYFTFNLTAEGLPDTGMSASALTATTLGGVSLLLAGAVILLFRRRRNA